MRLLWFTVVMAAGLSRAQGTMRDDFEGPALLLDGGGQWDVFRARAGITLAPAPGAGHQGGSALRLTDTAVGAGSNVEANVSRNLTGMGNQYVRFWFRDVQNTSPSAGTMSLAMIHINSNVFTAAEARWSWTTREVFLQCFDGNSVGVPTSGPRGFSDGGWHLIEVTAQGVGSASGACKLWFDGALIRSGVNINWSTNRFAAALLGEPYADDAFSGILDFDSWAASPAPMASGMKWTGPSQLDTNTCAPASLDFVDSVTGAVAPSTDPAMRLTVGVPAMGDALFVGGGCVKPIALPSEVFVVDGGIKTAAFSIRGTMAGAMMIVADSSDLLGTRATVNFLAPPDAGPGDAGAADAGASDAGLTDAGIDGGTSAPGPATYLVGCDCASTPALPFLIGVAALFGLRRRSANR